MSCVEFLLICFLVQELKDIDGELDEDKAERYWQNHISRNDSVVMDLFGGQLMSELNCCKCRNRSVSFDPFMDLSVQLVRAGARGDTATVWGAVACASTCS